MHPFATYVLRSYYKATGWNEDNLYANFIQTTYSMNALPSLNGSVGYIFTSCDLDIRHSKNVHFKDMVDRFKVYDPPRRPSPRDDVFVAGERVNARGT
jgi:distribution and morphology protein 10